MERKENDPDPFERDGPKWSLLSKFNALRKPENALAISIPVIGTAASLLFINNIPIENSRDALVNGLIEAVSISTFCSLGYATKIYLREKVSEARKAAAIGLGGLGIALAAESAHLVTEPLFDNFWRYLGTEDPVNVLYRYGGAYIMLHGGIFAINKARRFWPHTQNLSV